MELQGFLGHVGRRDLIEGGYEVHHFMIDAAQDALRATAGSTLAIERRTRCALC